MTLTSALTPYTCGLACLESYFSDIGRALDQCEILVRQQEEFSALLKSPHAKVVALSGSELAKESGAFLLFDPVTKKAWLYAFNLPALPSGKVYQLWAIDEKPVSAGVFNPDPGQKGRLMIKNLPDFSKMKTFAVSVEPTGGRPQPTGAIYLIGQT